MADLFVMQMCRSSCGSICQSSSWRKCSTWCLVSRGGTESQGTTISNQEVQAWMLTCFIFQSEVVLQNPSGSGSVSRLLLLLLFVQSILERDFTSSMMLGEGTGGRHSWRCKTEAAGASFQGHSSICHEQVSFFPYAQIVKRDVCQ